MASAPQPKERVDYLALVDYRVVVNDGKPQSMIDLITLKNIFAAQLPKMPRDYIVRLVLNRRHRSLCMVRKSDNQVIGGICYRPFPTQGFAEVVFCAITATEQVKGYGRATMNQLKEQVKIDSEVLKYPVKTEYFLTYADNHATVFFRKQGFSDKLQQPKDRYVGYIKDYDGGTLMECKVSYDFNYHDAKKMLALQREAVVTKIRAISKSHILHPGLTVFTPADAQSSSSSTSDNQQKTETKQRITIEVKNIPGVVEAGWKPTKEYPTRRGQAATEPIVATPLSDLQAKLGAVWKAIRNLKESWPFQKPVDRSVVPDYYKVIAEPMDLETMNKRLLSHYYKDKHMFIYDFMLIVNNCKSYNSPNTVYYKSAESLREAFLSLMVTFELGTSNEDALTSLP